MIAAITNYFANQNVLIILESFAIPWLGKLAKWFISKSDAPAESDEEKDKKRKRLGVAIGITVVAILFSIVVYLQGEAIALPIPAFMQNIQFPSLVSMSQDTLSSLYSAVLLLAGASIVYTAFRMIQTKEIADSLSYFILVLWYSIPLVLLFLFLGLNPFIGASISAFITIVVIIVTEEWSKKINADLFALFEKYEILKTSGLYYQIYEIEKNAATLAGRKQKLTIFYKIYTLAMYIFSFVFIVLQLVYTNFASFFSKAFWQLSLTHPDFNFLEIALQQFILAFVITILYSIKYYCYLKKEAKYEKEEKGELQEGEKVKLNFWTKFDFMKSEFFEFFYFGTIGSIAMFLLRYYWTSAIVAISVSMLTLFSLRKLGSYEDRKKQLRYDLFIARIREEERAAGEASEAQHIAEEEHEGQEAC